MLLAVSARSVRDPTERILRARLAAHAMHAQHDSRQTSTAGRMAFLQRFEDEVDPDRVLPIEERIRRSRHAQKAHMTRLALASARSRRVHAAGSSRR
jgi:hypothetical protein